MCDFWTKPHHAPAWLVQAYTVADWFFRLVGGCKNVNNRAVKKKELEKIKFAAFYNARVMKNLLNILPRSASLK